MIKSIKLNTWRQYEKVEITFHPRLTILTGANGTGKTTFLNIINQHFWLETSLVGTIKINEKTGVSQIIFDYWEEGEIIKVQDIGEEQVKIGDILYDNDVIKPLTIPIQTSSLYKVHIDGKPSVKGIHIPSHRPNYNYQPVSTISTTIISKFDAFARHSGPSQNRILGFGGGQNENYYIKEALISWATFGYGNQVVARNEEAIKLFEGFEDILKLVLPHKLGFLKFSIRIPDVILETSSGEFSIDSVSGGIASIIDLAWKIYMFDDEKSPFIVTFDEPENHLHPEMQKTLLSNFLSAFPRAQFIVATHNPFIISSVANSSVYVLDYNSNNKVESILLENIEKSGTANEILREVLGLETTTPKWVDTKLESIISKYSEFGITPENLLEFKAELREVGLDKYVPISVANLIEESKKNDKIE